MIRAHPGKILADEMRARALSANALALKLHVSARRITEIVNGKRSISPDTAIRLGHCFGTGAGLWIRLQADYDLAQAEKELGAAIRREVAAA